MIGYGLSGAMLFLAAYAPSRLIAVGALSLSIACLMSAESSFWSSAVFLADGPVGILSGMMNTAGIVGGIASTSLVPVLARNFGWGAALGIGQPHGVGVRRAVGVRLPHRWPHAGSEIRSRGQSDL